MLMHHVSEATIENYRSFKNDTIQLSSFTALVGYNNAGKTNLMSALKWVLRGGALQKNDFNDTEEAVTVCITIIGICGGVLDGLGEMHRPRLERYLVDGVLKIKRQQLCPGGGVRDARLYVWDENDQEWSLNPTGLDSAIKAAFPEPMVVNAMENAAEDSAKFAKSSTIGRILSDILEPMKQEQAEELQEAFDAIERHFAAEGANKSPYLRALDDRIAPALSQFFPNLNLKVHIGTPTIDSLMKGGTIKVAEDGFAGASGMDVTTLGHGAQRSVQIALLTVLSETRRASAHGTTLLLVDEPELYLHPQAIENVRLALKSLSESGYQVIFSTHSPQMISRDDASNVVLLRKAVERGSHSRKGLGRAVTEEIKNANHQAEMLYSFSNSSKFLFSESVLLAEGKTERNVFPHMFEEITGKTLVGEKKAFIDLGGVDNIPAAMRVLVAMDLPTKAVVDLDFAFKGALTSGLLDREIPAIETCFEAFRQLREEKGIVLSEDGLPSKGGDYTASQARRLLLTKPEAVDAINEIHELLKAQNIWMWKRGEIEQHLGIGGKTPLEWSRFVVGIKERDPAEVISDYDGVVELCSWLCE
jgi:predicted ATP-dependent endonuclease of OLD family